MIIVLLVALTVVAGVAFYLQPRRMNVPKCLVCSRRIVIRRRKVLECGRCKIRYHRTTVAEADGDAWERVRKQRLFSISLRRDIGVQHLLIEVPLTVSKGANQDTVAHA